MQGGLPGPRQERLQEDRSKAQGKPLAQGLFSVYFLLGAEYSDLQYSPVQYGTVQFSTAPYSAEQYSTGQDRKLATVDCALVYREN